MSSKYCPILESKTNIECVIGSDRADCLRRIHKGSAHFSVFSSEELVAARWSGVDVLVTSEMRYNHDQPFEYEIVVVIENESGIGSAQDLRGTRLCHPGMETNSADYTDILANVSFTNSEKNYNKNLLIFLLNFYTVFRINISSTTV